MNSFVGKHMPLPALPCSLSPAPGGCNNATAHWWHTESCLLACSIGIRNLPIAETCSVLFVLHSNVLRSNSNVLKHAVRKSCFHSTACLISTTKVPGLVIHGTVLASPVKRSDTYVAWTHDSTECDTSGKDSLLQVQLITSCNAVPGAT